MANYFKNEFSLKSPTFAINLTNKRVGDYGYSKESFILDGDNFKYFEVQASLGFEHHYAIFLSKIPNAFNESDYFSGDLIEADCNYIGPGYPATNNYPVGNHPTGYIRINGVMVGGRAREFPGFVNPGTPQRFGIAVNKNTIRVYYIISSTNYSYNIHFEHTDSFPKGSRFRLAYRDYGYLYGENTGILTGYSDPSTWMAGGSLGYTDPLFGEVDQLKQY